VYEKYTGCVEDFWQEVAKFVFNDSHQQSFLKYGRSQACDQGVGNRAIPLPRKYQLVVALPMPQTDTDKQW